MTLHTGKAFAVIGPSGCGKSTLLKGLSGQVAPEQGTVFQEDQLFPCSLYDNIAMNDVDVTMAKVHAAARNSACYWPGPYTNNKQPRFLLLDEYTSMLDFETERHVQASINALGCGQFILTQREHSLLPEDEVHVLSGGSS
ncbi:MAG: ATP-binding cassette domain-containing protein [Burkholderiales bacterium]|nr:ATP-binding cassette domain-containing protein [Burkholderiales bacterium]